MTAQLVSLPNRKPLPERYAGDVWGTDRHTTEGRPQFALEAGRVLRIVHETSGMPPGQLWTRLRDYDVSRPGTVHSRSVVSLPLYTQRIAHAYHKVSRARLLSIVNGHPTTPRHAQAAS